MFIFRHVIEALLNPFFLIVLLFTLCLILLWWKGEDRLVRYGFSLTFFLLLLVSMGWLPHKLTVKLENQYPAIAKVDPNIHWVVVFSGGQSDLKNMLPNNLLNSATTKRLIEGVRLYRQLPEAKLLLSGRGYGGEVPEAKRMSELASWFAIPAHKRVLETASLNTADQAKEIKKILHAEPFYLVTSAIHMPRSMLLCQAQGLHPIAAPTDYTLYWDDERWAKSYLPNPHNLFYLSIAMHELLGRVWATLQDN